MRLGGRDAVLRGEKRFSRVASFSRGRRNCGFLRDSLLNSAKEISRLVR